MKQPKNRKSKFWVRIKED